MLAAPQLQGPPESKKPLTNIRLASFIVGVWQAADFGEIRTEYPQTLMAA